ncbi:MAG: hypothetical protein ABI548_25865 [Polyangiaceae bacterium]
MSGGPGRNTAQTAAASSAESSSAPRDKFWQYPSAQVVGVADPKELAVSDYNGSYGTTCALDGTRGRCWGPNNSGNSGVGNNVSLVTTPTLVVAPGLTPLDDVLDVSGSVFAGGAHVFCALRGATARGACESAAGSGALALAREIEQGQRRVGGRPGLRSRGLYGPVGGQQRGHHGPERPPDTCRRPPAEAPRRVWRVRGPAPPERLPPVHVIAQP